MSNALGIPGLAKRPDGRYRLIFRYRCPVDRTAKQLTKLYPAAWSAKLIVSDAQQRTRDAVSGRLAEVEASKPTPSRTIAELAPEVLRARETDEIAPASLHEFKSILVGGDPNAKKGRKGGGRIVRLLGHLAPSDLDSENLSVFIGALRTDGLSVESVQNHLKVLSVFIRHVRVLRLDPKLTSNPLRDALDVGLRRPTKRRAAPIHLSIAQAEALLASPKLPAHRRVRYMVALFSGLRDGEIAGLRWADVDLNERTIDVSKAYACRGGLRATKTAAGERKVPIHPELAATLRLHRAERLADLRCPEGEREKALEALPLFVDKQGKAHRPSSAKLLQKDLVAADVDAPAGVTFHALRRSFATWLGAAGVAHEVTEALMGHEPRSVLGRHYAATDLDVLRKAVALIGLASRLRVRAVA